MIPAGFENVEQQLLIWMLAMIRPGAAFLVAPMFGAGSVPIQLRLVLALAVGIPSAAAANRFRAFL
jgi:flagellar biosynthesis protein FliR